MRGAPRVPDRRQTALPLIARGPPSKDDDDVVVEYGVPSWCQGEVAMARSRSLRSQLYRMARDMGNAQAAARGPGAYAKRVVRRRVYRGTTGLTRRLLRGLGL